MVKPVRHRNNSRIHAFWRALDRYGVTYSGKVRRDILDQIRNGRSEFISKLTNTRSVYKVTVGDISLYAVYSTSQGEIITFLPEEYIRRNNDI